MCLEFVQEPLVKEGIGYKVVRKTKKLDEFLPEYLFFGDDGRGGVGFDAPYARIYKSKSPLYKLNKTYRVHHTRRAISGCNEKYRAGVHLYKDRDIACAGFVYDDFVVIQCSYHKAIAEDDDVVVALEITPLKVVK